MLEKEEQEEPKKDREAESVKMKAGLEIHQQLDTGKLFCRCPSILRNEKGDWIVKRKLHAVAGESGEVDIAAQHETAKEKEFIYEGFKDTCCLVEFDECPPYSINQEALKIACQVALLLNCEIRTITQIMRKTVIDGSNTSGFQRTLIIAQDGFIETSYGKVRIATVCLEEDAARKVDSPLGQIIFRLDRLGIPLVEIATYPDLYYPEQVKEAALKLGEIIRACKVKRGIGTIRQDVNISTLKHPRVEIKGFQEPRIMIQTVELEIERQKKLVEIHEELVKRKASVDENIIDLTKLFEKTACNFVKNSIEKQGKVLGIKLKGFSGLIGRELYENRRFGTELSERAKMFGVGGIIHSDEKLEKYNFSEMEIKKVKEILKIKEKDAFILVIDLENKARKAIFAVIQRAKMQIEKSGISEVRKSNENATTSFLRPMPGADRMYPETDLELLKISRDFINEVRNSLPKLRSDIKGELKTKGLSEEMIKLILDENKLEELEDLLKIYNQPNFVVKLLLIFPKEIASHQNVKEEIFSLEIIKKVLEAIKDKKISEGDSKHVFEEFAKGKSIEEALKIDKLDMINIETEIAKIVKEKPGLNSNAYMGLVMAKFKGKVSGKEVMDILKKLVK